MKLVKVNHKPFAYLHCSGVNCPNRKPYYTATEHYFNTDTEHAYANLDGEAYKSYYCEDCAKKLESELK
jgi:hypothetical protein